MLKFHELHIKRITALTDDAVSLCFAVPDALRESFAFKQGQYLTLRTSIAGEDVRRSYSICTSVQHYAQTGEIEVGIRRVDEGVFSNWACSTLKVGNSLQVMPPQGRFFTKLDASQSKHYLGIAAGSGITPLMSLIATTLETEQQSHFTLIYGNRKIASTMFLEQLQALKDRYLERLQLLFCFSRQAQEIALFHGRLDAERLRDLMTGPLNNTRFDAAFICGPEAMIDDAEQTLLSLGMSRESVHTERFATGATRAAHAVREKKTAMQDASSKHDMVIVLDGKHHHVPIADDETVLDAALDAGLDLPYSCKGGVCCTCRAKVIEGRVEMEKYFTLEQWEIDKGFVLTCQSHRKSEQLVISFDER